MCPLSCSSKAPRRAPRSRGSMRPSPLPQMSHIPRHIQQEEKMEWFLGEEADHRPLCAH